MVKPATKFSSFTQITNVKCPDMFEILQFMHSRPHDLNERQDFTMKMRSCIALLINWNAAA